MSITLALGISAFNLAIVAIINEITIMRLQKELCEIKGENK